MQEEHEVELPILTLGILFDFVPLLEDPKEDF